MSLLAASVLWGTTGSAQALAGATADPPLVGAARLLFGAGLLLTLCLTCGRRSALRAVLAPQLRRWTIAAGVAAAVYQAAFFTAVSDTGVALGTLIALGSAPVFCGLLARQLAAEQLPRAWAAATACAVIGCSLLLLPGDDQTTSLVGIALALLSGACYATYTVCAKRLLSSGSDPLAVLATTLGLGAVVLAPVFLAGAGELATPSVALLVAWLAVATTAGAYLLFVHGLARVGAATAGTLSLAKRSPPPCWASHCYRERPSAVSAAGAGLLTIGLALNALAPTSGPVASERNRDATPASA